MIARMDWVLRRPRGLPALSRRWNSGPSVNRTFLLGTFRTFSLGSDKRFVRCAAFACIVYNVAISGRQIGHLG